MADKDPLNALVDEIGRRRQPHVSLYVTAAEVFSAHVESLDNATFNAFEVVGWKAIDEERGYPAEIPLPEVLDSIEHGETFDDVGANLGVETHAKLAFLGFMTLA